MHTKNIRYRKTLEITELEFQFEKTLNDSVITMDGVAPNELSLNEEPAWEKNVEPANLVLLENLQMELNSFETLGNFDEDYQNNAASSNRFTAYQTQALHDVWDGGKNRYPSRAEKEDIQEITNLSQQQVDKWFTNKRYRM